MLRYWLSESSMSSAEVMCALYKINTVTSDSNISYNNSSKTNEFKRIRILYNTEYNAPHVWHTLSI